MGAAVFGSHSPRFSTGVHNGEVFDTLLEAKVLIEPWRQDYNRHRPHSALGYRSPAPETIEPRPVGFALRRLDPWAALGLT